MLHGVQCTQSVYCASKITVLPTSVLAAGGFAEPVEERGPGAVEAEAEGQGSTASRG